MGWEDYTGGGYNWWDTDFSTDPADTDITDVDFSTYDTVDADADADADTVAVDQQIEDLFEDSDFIAGLTEIMQEQNFFPNEQGLGEWTNDDWYSYLEDFLDPNYKWWETDFSTYPEKQTDVNGDPLPETTDVPVGATHEVTDENGNVVIYESTLGPNGEKIWTKGKGGEEKKDGEKQKDVFGQDLPDPTGLSDGDRHEVNIPITGGTVIYEIKDGVWHQIEEEEDEIGRAHV